MSTRCAIIRRREDGRYEGVYCHSDGYPAWTGAILQVHYTDPDKVAELLALGNLSILGPRVSPDPDRPHGFGWDERQKGVTVAYGRDRDGEPDVGPVVGPTCCGVARRIWHDGHIYVFEDGAWTHNGEPLAEVLAGLEGGDADLAKRAIDCEEEKQG